ncbi:MAG: dUTP diphosphatase [Candidatus Omnitrophica bacterium]|nr:dUTP diphosphatase [Candidatus Omnitrophota bacterium]
MIFYYQNESLKPYKKHADDAGWDIRCKESITIRPNETRLIKTGVSAIIPNGYVGIIKCRSGLATNGLNVNGGVIDSTYRGEIGVIIQNLGAEPITFEAYERIAQMLVIPCLSSATLVEGVAPQDTDRSANGYGSSGRL